jgi:hypothetical protein
VVDGVVTTPIENNWPLSVATYITPFLSLNAGIFPMVEAQMYCDKEVIRAAVVSVSELTGDNI